MPTSIRGKLCYIANAAHIQQCPCEPASNPPLDVLLAVASGVPDDIDGAANYLKNLGWANGACVAVQGQFGTVGVNVRAFYLKTVKDCPTGPCNQ